MTLELETLPEQVERMLADARKFHHPRSYGGGGYGGGKRVRCVSCAVNGPNGLRRADWPCPTAVVLGIDDQRPK